MVLSGRRHHQFARNSHVQSQSTDSNTPALVRSCAYHFPATLLDLTMKGDDIHAPVLSTRAHAQPRLVEARDSCRNLRTLLLASRGYPYLCTQRTTPHRALRESHTHLPHEHIHELPVVGHDAVEESFELSPEIDRLTGGRLDHLIWRKQFLRNRLVWVTGNEHVGSIAEAQEMGTLPFKSLD